MPIEVASAENGCRPELLDGLNTSLHAMSQPLTALLCVLEYGTGLDATGEVKTVIAGGLEQSLRLMETVRQMQRQVLDSMPPERVERRRHR